MVNIIQTAFKFPLEYIFAMKMSGMKAQETQDRLSVFCHTHKPESPEDEATSNYNSEVGKKVITGREGKRFLIFLFFVSSFSTCHAKCV